jgi:hypothetical protein
MIPPPLRLEERRQRSSLPLPPIATTAKAISNHSAYLRSLGPSSLSSLITPHLPFAAADSPEPALLSLAPARVRSLRQPTAPMSVLRGTPCAPPLLSSARDPVPVVVLVSPLVTEPWSSSLLSKWRKGRTPHPEDKPCEAILRLPVYPVPFAVGCGFA